MQPGDQKISPSGDANGLLDRIRVVRESLLKCGRAVTIYVLYADP